MNINCVNRCKYQQEGKCVMHSLPDSLPDAIDSDCPYCRL